MPEAAPPTFQRARAREILAPIPMLSTPLLSDEDVVRPAGVGLTAATLSLVKTCIGTGVMALPYAFTQAGSFAVPGMLLLGVWNFYTCHQLLRARAALPAKVQSARSAYSAVVEAALGNVGVLILEGSLCVSLVLVCASLQVQTAQLVAAPSGFEYTTCVLGAGIALVPLVLVRSLACVAFVAVSGLVALGVGLLAVAAHGLARYSLHWPPPSSLVDLPAPHNFAIFFGIASFSFGLQMTLLPVQDGMRRPSHATNACGYALCIVVTSYLVIGLLLAWLYSSDLDGVQQLILLNLERSSLIAAVVQYTSALVALLSYPLPLLPLIELLSSLVCGACAPSFTRDAALRLTTLLSTTLIAQRLPQFGIAAGLAGCLCIVSTQLLPPLCHLRLCSWPSEGSWPSALLDVLLFFAGLVVFCHFTMEVALELVTGDE